MHTRYSAHKLNLNKHARTNKTSNVHNYVRTMTFITIHTLENAYKIHKYVNV